MRLIAKAALGALALASVATTTPALADHVVVQLGTPGVVVQPRDPCLRAPAFRPMYCFRHDRGWHNGWGQGGLAFNDRDRFMRDRMWRDRERERERQAFLEHRYYDMR
jgi:hypothetical protein